MDGRQSELAGSAPPPDDAASDYADEVSLEPLTDPAPPAGALRRRSVANPPPPLSKPLISQSKSTGDLRGPPSFAEEPPLSPAPSVPMAEAFRFARRRSTFASYDYTPELRRKIEDPGYLPPEKELAAVPLTIEGAVGDVEVPVKEPSIHMPQADDAPPDGGYGWVIVAIVFLVHFLPLGGILYTFGVFQRYYVSTNTFPGATNLQISFIGSIGSAAMPGLGPLTGRFADKYGYRLATLIGSIVLLLAMVLASFATQLWQAYLTQGLLFGVSMSLAYFPNISCVPQWFSRRRGLAVGLAVSGAGLGGLAMSPAVQAMLASLGHAWTLRILGILGSSATFLSAVFLRTRVPPKPRGPVVAWQYFKIPSFSVLFGASFLGAFGYFTGFYFVSPFATSNGMTASQGALAVALMNGASAVGRVFQGLVADAYLGPFNSFVACQVLAPLSTLVIWPFATSFGVLILYSVVYGFFAGGFVSLFPVVLTIIFGTEEVATVLGTQALSGVVGNLAGPPLAGLILDSTGSYVPLQMFAGFVMLSSALLIGWVRHQRAGGKIFVKL